MGVLSHVQAKRSAQGCHEMWENRPSYILPSSHLLYFSLYFCIMDSLEAFERGRDLPFEALGPPINPFESEIIPLKLDGSFSHVWQEFNRSAIFFLDDNVVVKAQKQYHVPSISSPADRFLLDLGLANFDGTRLERQVFAMLQSSPHPNLVRCLDFKRDYNADHTEYIMFFEKLDPLSSVWAKSNPTCRRRWAIELTSAFSHLELLGLIPSKTCVRDLTVDKYVSALRNLGTRHAHLSTIPCFHQCEYMPDAAITS